MPFAAQTHPRRLVYGLLVIYSWLVIARGLLSWVMLRYGRLEGKVTADNCARGRVLHDQAMQMEPYGVIRTS